MIYGPVIMNAEVLVSKSGPEQVRHVGIGQQRGHLQTLIQETYPQITSISQMSPRMLPYSLEEGQIDGAVMDVTKAALLEGVAFSPVAEDDYISYVLVVRKELAGTKAFTSFLESYRKAVDVIRKEESTAVSPEAAPRIKFLYLD